VREQRRLPEALDLADVQAFLSGLRTHRDRAMVLAMLLGGLRSAEVRGLLLADVDQGRRRLRVLGKGGRDRVVPVDAAFFAELAAYLRHERPPRLATPECFVVLRGPTTGAPVSEARLRALFRRHRAASGAIRVRPHRLRHTYGTELAAGGIDLLALRELMGHASPETTSRYVRLSTEHLAAEYAAARDHGGSAVSAAVARTATSTDHDWFAAYVAHCQRLGCSDRALRDRLCSARALLAAHPDLQAWMGQPTVDRVVELRRTRAWPLLVFLIGTGRLRLDLELAGAKHLTGLGDIVEHQHVADFATARAAGLRLGWTPDWVDTVLHECLAVLLACHGGTIADLGEQVVEEFDHQLAQSMHLSQSSLRAYRARLASLRHLLFEIGVHDTPPRRRPWSRTLEQRFAEVAMADAIRAVLLRYVQTRASVLRPRSVESLVNDLLPFAEFLTAQHSEVTSLRGLQRSHVEEFLVWNRTRPWRGRKARPRPVSVAVAQSTVLSLRNLLEDIAVWGWAEAPRAWLLIGGARLRWRGARRLLGRSWRACRSGWPGRAIACGR
jgi:hypothetical protein